MGKPPAPEFFVPAMAVRASARFAARTGTEGVNALTLQIYHSVGLIRIGDTR